MPNDIKPTHKYICHNGMEIFVGLCYSEKDIQTGILSVVDPKGVFPQRTLLFSTSQVADDVAQLIARDWEIEKISYGNTGWM